MNTTPAPARPTPNLDAMSDVSELQRLGSFPMCIALDKSGSTYGPTLAAELEVARELSHQRRHVSSVPVKVLPWCHKAYSPIELLDGRDTDLSFGSGGGTDPSSLYALDGCLEALRSAGLWVLMTDGKIYDSLVEKFATQTPEVGIHNKPCVIIVFGDTSHGRPAACNISVGIAVYAVVPDCLFLFHDTPTGIVRVMQAKGKFKELLPMASDGQRVKLEVSAYTAWAELPWVAYEDLFDVELSAVRNLDPDEMAFQDGLIVNIPDMLAGKVDEKTIESIVHNSDNLRSIALAAKTKGTGKYIATWLKAQQKELPRKRSLPEDVGKRANLAINNLLEALRTGEPKWTLENLRKALRDAHAQNMTDFWVKQSKGDESETEIRRRNLRLRNAAKASLPTERSKAKSTFATKASPESDITQDKSAKLEEPTVVGSFPAVEFENNMPSTSSGSGFNDPITAMDFQSTVPTTSAVPTANPFPITDAANPTPFGLTINTHFLPRLETTGLGVFSKHSVAPSLDAVELGTGVSTPEETNNYTVSACGYASGASDQMERSLRAVRDIRPQVNASSSLAYKDDGSKRRRGADEGRSGLASRLVRRKRAQRSRSSSISGGKRDPILVPNFQRHDPENEFRGRCMLCHNDDAVLALLLKKPPPVTTEGFPREGSNTKIAFPLAMGSFAEMKTVSSFVACDACTFHLLRIGTCPTSEIIVGALCLASLSENRAALLESIDLAIRGRFDNADLMAIFMSMLDAKLLDEKNQATPADEEKNLFRKCAEWVLLNLIDVLEVPKSLSPAFADSSSETPPMATLKLVLESHEFCNPARADNKELLLLRYPIPGFLVLLRLLCLLESVTAEQAHTLVFQKVMFLVMEHYIEQRASSAPRLSNDAILRDGSGSPKACFSLVELDEHGLLDSGSLQSLNSMPDFEVFQQRSGPALAVFLHCFLRGGTGYSTATDCFNNLKVEPALTNLFLAPLGISSGLAADMISNLCGDV